MKTQGKIISKSEDREIQENQLFQQVATLMPLTKSTTTKKNYKNPHQNLKQQILNLEHKMLSTLQQIMTLSMTKALRNPN